MRAHYLPLERTIAAGLPSALPQSAHFQKKEEKRRKKKKKEEEEEKEGRGGGKESLLVKHAQRANRACSERQRPRMTTVMTVSASRCTLVLRLKIIDIPISNVKSKNAPAHASQKTGNGTGRSR